jgi:hypothetical protein
MMYSLFRFILEDDVEGIDAALPLILWPLVIHRLTWFVVLTAT